MQSGGRGRNLSGAAGIGIAPAAWAGAASVARPSAIGRARPQFIWGGGHWRCAGGLGWRRIGGSAERNRRARPQSVRGGGHWPASLAWLDSICPCGHNLSGALGIRGLERLLSFLGQATLQWAVRRDEIAGTSCGLPHAMQRQAQFAQDARLLPHLLVCAILAQQMPERPQAPPRDLGALAQAEAEPWSS